MCEERAARGLARNSRRYTGLNFNSTLTWSHSHIRLPERTFFSKSVVYKSIYKIVKLYNLNCYHAIITPHIITEHCGTKQNLPLKMVPVNPLAHGLHWEGENNVVSLKTPHENSSVRTRDACMTGEAVRRSSHCAKSPSLPVFSVVTVFIHQNLTFTVFICQNLTSTDVRFWHIKTVPALKGLKQPGM